MKSNVITNIISAYAPTLETTLKNLETTRHFYEKLSSIIKTFKAREAVIIGGYFNAKTNSKFSNFPTNIIGKYAKSEINVKGEKNDRILFSEQVEDHKHIFQTQTYPSNNMAITSPICQHNRLQKRTHPEETFSEIK